MFCLKILFALEIGYAVRRGEFMSTFSCVCSEEVDARFAIGKTVIFFPCLLSTGNRPGLRIRLMNVDLML